MRQIRHCNGIYWSQTVPSLILNAYYNQQHTDFIEKIITMEFDDILMGGMVFKKKKENTEDPNKVKTKAKKKKYITGAHGSGSAKQKAKYREQRANRHKG